MPLSEGESQKMWQEFLDAITPIFRKYTAVSAKTVQQPQQPQVKKLQTVDDVKKNFPEDLESLLNFEETQDLIIIKPRQYLGSEKFAEIASVVRGIGGDYVSAGKQSHFRVPKKV
jgi:hypothetical protein